MAIRTARMLAAGANPGAADRTEFSQMRTEKLRAFWESMFAMQAQIVKTQQEYVRTAALECWRMWATPWWLAAYRPVTQAMASLPRAALLLPHAHRGQSQGALAAVVEAGLTPVHKRATANARRLGRIKRR
jgi:hypothetical protein